MDLLVMLLLLLCMAASVPATTSINHSAWKTYSHSLRRAYADHHQDLYSRPRHQGTELYGHMPRGFTSLLRHSDSERIEEEGDQFMVSLMEARAQDKSDLDALLSFKKFIVSELDILSNWTVENSENMCSSWYGIYCQPHTKIVVAIDLSRKELEGRILAKFGQLKALRALDLRYNKLSGSIPLELGKLQALGALDLSYNQLSGSIPVQLGMLQKLESLALQGNNFTGSIPRQLGNLTRLRHLSFSRDNMNMMASILFEIFQRPLRSLSLGLR
eukprot:PITA_10938